MDDTTETSTFRNAPTGREFNSRVTRTDQTTRTYRVTTQNHHVISNDAFNDSSFMKALQAEGLWDQQDFRLNGVQLPDMIDRNHPSSFANRKNIVGGATHTGGHSAYNTHQKSFLAQFDDRLDQLAMDPNTTWERHGSRSAWLQAQSKKIYGYVGFMKSELVNPNGVLKLNTRDGAYTNLKSGTVWKKMDTLFDDKLLEFDSVVKQHQGYKTGATGTYAGQPSEGRLTGGLAKLDASQGTGTAFDRSTAIQPQDVQGLLKNQLKLTPKQVDIFNQKFLSGVSRTLGALASVAVLGAFASVGLATAARAAEESGRSLADVLTDFDLTEAQLKALIADAGADAALTGALSASPLAAAVWAKRAVELILDGQDVIDLLKQLENLYPNSEFVGAAAAAGRAIESTSTFEAVKTVRDKLKALAEQILGANDGKLQKDIDIALSNPITRSITDALAGDTRVESQTGELGHVFPNGTRGTSKWTRLKNGTSVQELRDKNGLLLQRNYWKGGQKALSETPDPENPGTSRITTFDNGEPAHTGTLGPSGGTNSQPVPRPDSVPVEPPKSLDDFLDALPNRGPDGKLKWDWSTAELIPQVNLPSGDPPPPLPAGLPAPYRVKDSSGKVTREVTPLPSRDPGETRYRETIKGPKGEVRIDRIEPAGPQFDPNGAIPPLPVQAPRIEQFDLKVPGAPPEQLHSSVTYKSVRMGLGGPVGILRERDVNNGVPGEWKTTVTPAASQPKQIPLISFESAGGDITGSAIGSIFGSTIGQAIGGRNVFARVLAGSALATALGKLAGGFGTTTTVDSLTLAISSADHISTAFAQNLAGQGIGAVSAFLTAELAEGLGIDTADFGGKLFSFVANTATNTLLKTAIVNVIGKNPILQGFSGRLFQFGIQSSAVFTNVSVGAFIGSYLGSQIVQPQNIAGSIGASALSSVGSLIGASQAVLNAVAAAIGAVGSAVATAVLSFVLPVIGSLIGYVFGAKIGNWLNRKFGIGADQGDGIYEVRLAAGSTATPSGHLIVNNDEDFGLPARELHQATIDILESLLPRIGAGATNAVTIRYQISAQGHDGADPRVKRRNYVTVSGVEGAGEYRNEEDVGALLGYGVHFALKGLDLNNARALRVANQHSDRNVTRQLCHVQVKQPDASSIAIDRKLNKIVTITSALSVLDAGPRNTHHNGRNELRPPHRCFRDSSHPRPDDK